MLVLDLPERVAFDQRMAGLLSGSFDLVCEWSDVDLIGASGVEDLLELEEITYMRADEDATLGGIEATIEGST